jgi:hypothetical protein
LLWIVLCVVGPELVRVKDLARRSNNPTLMDYQTALKTSIVYRRGSAGTELTPSQLQPSTVSSSASSNISDPDFPDNSPRIVSLMGFAICPPETSDCISLHLRMPPTSFPKLLSL